MLLPSGLPRGRLLSSLKLGCLVGPLDLTALVAAPRAGAAPCSCGPSRLHGRRMCDDVRTTSRGPSNVGL